MNTNILRLVLADDDIDDCILFKEILDQAPFLTQLTQFHYGDQLMEWLQISSPRPDALFIDLNMPRKSGFQCLTEIRKNEQFKQLPVFVISTSYEKQVAAMLYKNGATFYIRKPLDFLKLRIMINHSLSLLTKEGVAQPPMEKFVLTAL